MQRKLANLSASSCLSSIICGADELDLRRREGSVAGGAWKAAVPMTERISVLLVHHHGAHMAPLEASLVDQSMEILRAQNCPEAARILAGPVPPHLVFVDAALPDASWADVIALSRKASVPVNVIVVARLVDTRFYVEVIEAGAYDFIAPPFRPNDLAHVLRCAIQNVIERREAQLRAEQAAQRLLFPSGLASDHPNAASAGPIAHLGPAGKAL